MEPRECVYELGLQLKVISISLRQYNAGGKWSTNWVKLVLEWNVIGHDWICIKKWCMCKCNIPNKSWCNRILVPHLHAQHKQRSPNKQSEKGKITNNNKEKKSPSLSRIPGPRWLLTVRFFEEGFCLNQTTANQPDRGKIRWEVSVRKQWVLIMPNHGIFEA